MSAVQPNAYESPERFHRSHAIVGIDGSEQSSRALRWAASFAETTDGTVTAVAVWHVPVQFGAPVITAPSMDFEAQARQWIREAVRELSDAEARRVDAVVSGGNIAEALLEHARTADLLVVGNKGRGALASALIGSVAVRCAHHATCPVVLVP